MKNASKINSNWMWILAVVVMLLPGVSANAKKKVVEQTNDTAFPEAFVRKVDGAQRFQNPAYFSLMAGSGIQSQDVKVLYARLQAAVAANERYKALYLARVFTSIKPDVAAAWSNRAALASALGLSDEASVCQANAKDVQHLATVPPSVLPGAGLTVKPASLADWASAMALLSDDTAAKERHASLVAVKDSVSGIHQATDEEIQERTRSYKEDGLTPPGPWARPEAIRLQHILPNAFSLGTEEPMHYKSMSAGGMFGAMLMAGMAGMQQNYNPQLAQQAQEMSQEMAGRAGEVPSHYKGGSYTKITYVGGKAVSSLDHPQPSGEFETVGLPVPLLWASGGTREPIYAGSWKGTEKARGRHYTAEELERTPARVRSSTTFRRTCASPS